MEIRDSARKHGISDAVINWVFENAMRYVEFEYNGEERLLVIGADTSGRLIELIAVPAGAPTKIIHADDLQPNRFKYLR